MWVGDLPIEHHQMKGDIKGTMETCPEDWRQPLVRDSIGEEDEHSSGWYKELGTYEENEEGRDQEPEKKKIGELGHRNSEEQEGDFGESY